MTSKADFTSHIVDMFEAFGKVEAKRMFSGFGVSHQGLMIGLVSDNCLYLKADNQRKVEFEAGGSTPFSYFKKEI
jgi:DNA transformation protein